MEASGLRYLKVMSFFYQMKEKFIVLSLLAFILLLRVIISITEIEKILFFFNSR